MSEKKSDVVYKKRHGKIPVEITKDSTGFTVHIDGDVLDTYKDMQHAKKSMETALKELGK